MKKKMLTFCLIMTAILALFGCAKKDKVKQPVAEDVSVETILPQTAYFASVRRQLKDVEWNKYIFSGSVEYDKNKDSKTIWAYDMGCLLTNCGFASAIRDQDKVKHLSDEILAHSQQSGIVDEDVILKIMDIINSFDALVKDENYKEISNKIKEIEATIRGYYKGKTDEDLIKYIKFSSWLEAFYIVSCAVTDNYNDNLVNLYNRGQEIVYFTKLFNGTKLELGEEEFLAKMGKLMEKKENITGDTVKSVFSEITTMRSVYVK